MAAVIFVFGFAWLIRALNAPWSIRAFEPTLTGSWFGRLQARQGAAYILLVTIEYEERGRSSTNLRGQGRLCNQPGQTFQFTLRGDASRTGDRVTLTLPKADDVRPGPGLQLEGSWNGQRLTIRPTANPFLPDGTFQAVRTVSTDDPDDSFSPTELATGEIAAFEAACRQLARRGS